VSRVRTLFVTVLPSAIAGGFLFASAFGHAETGPGGALGFWPSASDSATGSVLVAQADPRPAPRYRGGPMPPAPPSPPTAVPPVPPAPPALPGRGHGRGHGVSVSIHGDKIQIDGIAELVQNQLESVSSLLDSLPDVPPDVRERVRARIKAVRDKINARLGKLKAMDLDKLDRLGPEMERMGDEIEKEMEGLDNDLAQLGDKIGKSFARKFGKDFAKNFGPTATSVPTPTVRPSRPGHDSDDADDDDDDDDSDSASVMPGTDADPAAPADLAPAVAAIRGIALDPQQRAELAKLRESSDREIKTTERELERLTTRLHDTLLDGSSSEDDIARQIDSISAREASIRKARILTWVKARNLLRKDQRKLVETAVKKTH
jgi:hypothetical protein